MSPLRTLLFPGGALVLLGWTWGGYGGADGLGALAPGVVWSAYALVFLLSVRFRRTRVAAATLLLFLWDPGEGGASGAATAALQTGALLDTGWSWPAILLTLGLLANLRDGGIRSREGWLQLSLPALLLVLALVLDRNLPAGSPLGSPGGVPWAAGAGGGLLLLAALRRPGPVESGLLWAGAALLPVWGLGAAPALGWLLALLVLGASVVELGHGLAYRDELTGLPSRRALREALADARAPYTLAMVDVDHFKKFNDRHGHDVGDQVLRMVATRLGRCPGGGQAFRYGGEEFTLLFPGRDRKAVAEILDTVREAVADARFRLRRGRRSRRAGAGRDRRGTGTSPRQLSVTVSIGAADTTQEGSPEAILKRADQALYRAKRGGRNRVVV